MEGKSTVEKSRLMSISEAAKLLGVRPAFVYQLTYAGSLPYVRLGARKMVKVVDLDSMIEANTVVAGGKK